MTQKDTQNPASRIIELDALRGIAAVAVLVCHLPRGFWFGETGVDLFFVLSGFLITGIILRNLDQPAFLRTFYWRRSLRIFPIYYLALLAVYSVNAFRSNPEDTTGFPFYLAYLQRLHGYWGGNFPVIPSLAHTWTLAIEEQFYIFWPFALVLSRRRLAPWLAGLFILLPFALRYLGLSRSVLFGHTDGLALGAMLAWIMLKTEGTSKERKGAWYAGIAIASFIGYWVLFWNLSSENVDFTGKDFIAFNPAISIISIAYFGLIGFVVCMSGYPWLAVLRNKHLVSIGTISYGLYLYHWIIYDHIDTVINFGWQMGDPWWLDVTKLGVSFVAAVISWRFIERPILCLKDRFNYRPRKH